MCFCGLALVIPGLSAPLANAQPKARAPAGKFEGIRAFMEKGQAEYAAGKYSEAAQTFEQGYREYPYSAFLFNAGVAYQKLAAYEKALQSFREYLAVDPKAPDADRVRQRIVQLESALAAQGANKRDPAKPAPKPDPIPTKEDSEAMKALVLVETDPPGAPLTIYRRTSNAAKAFRLGGENAGWTIVGRELAPANLTLDVGRYHIVVEPFEEFNASETELEVLPGRVHQFKANLSQGAFMAFVRVSSNVPGAALYLDDPRKRKPAWGNAPYGALVGSGEHSLLVEAPGYKPKTVTFELVRGEQKEVFARLERLDTGILRVAANVTPVEVRVDGRLLGNTSETRSTLDVSLPAGSHKVSISSPGRKTFEGTVEVPRGQVLPVRATLIPKYPRGAAWAQAVVAGLFVGTGVVLGVESNRLHGELEDDRDAGVLENDDERINRGRWFSIGADIGFAVGGALGALATYNFVRDPYPPSALERGPLLEFGQTAPVRRTTPPAGGSASIRLGQQSSALGVSFGGQF